MYNTLIGTQQINTKLLVGCSQGAIDELYGKVLDQIEHHVETRQIDKPLGVGSGAYPDIECDEVTVAKRLRPDGKLEWVQYWGVMRRGAPSLKLIKLPSRVTPKRAPGPGPIQLKMWSKLAQQHILGEDVIYHTDSARAYDTVPDEQTLHTRVVHKRKYKDGVLVKPKYIELVTLKMPNGRTLQVMKGT
eukprot:1190387-Amphidinium_carterae.1